MLLPSMLFPQLHSHFLVFQGRHENSILHTITVGTEGRYLVVLVEVVAVDMLGLGVLMVA